MPARSSLEPLPAEREDRVGVEPVERAQADHRVVASRARSPSRRCRSASVPSSHVAYSSTAILAVSLARSRRRCSAAGEDAGAGRDELVEERRQLARGLDLDLLPAPDLRDRRPGLRLLEVGADRLQPAGDRVEPLGRAARGRGRTAGTGCRRRGRARTSGAPRAGGRRCRRWSRRTLWISRSRSKRASADSAGRVDAPRPRRGARAPRRARPGPLAAAVAQQVVVLVQARAPCRAPGCRGRAGRSAPRRGRRTRRRAGPGAAAARGAGAARQVVGRSSGWNLRRAGNAARIGVGGPGRGRGRGQAVATSWCRHCDRPSGSSRRGPPAWRRSSVSMSSAVTP